LYYYPVLKQFYYIFIFYCISVLIHSIYSAKWINIADVVLQKVSEHSFGRSRRSVSQLSPRELINMRYSEELNQVDEAFTSDGTKNNKIPRNL